MTALGGVLNLDGDVKKTRLKLTWLAAVDSCETVALQLVDFDYLITKKKVEEDDNFMDLVNPATRFEKAAIGERQPRRAFVAFLRRWVFALCLAQGACEAAPPECVLSAGGRCAFP